MFAYLAFSAVLTTTAANNWFLIGSEIARIMPEPDFYRNGSELIISKGYPLKTHVVQTEDGYLLSILNIPHGRNGTLPGKREVVFLQHGFLAGSDDWILNFPEQSLGFILADAGYDVWMGNTRGNIYSMRHVKYTPEMDEFWENSTFNEMGIFDIPAMIDYVLNATGEKQLSYVGHSQGTAAGFVMLIERPDYTQKIKRFIGLAPVTTVGYMTSPLHYIAEGRQELEFFSKLFDWKDFLPNSTFTKLLEEVLCVKDNPWLCKWIASFVYGDSTELNTTRIQVYASHFPAGTSVKSIIHWAQLYQSGKFAKYDYGKEGNLAFYNQELPPEYDLSRITVPVYLASAPHDSFNDPRDVNLLLKKLNSVIEDYRVPHNTFNHADFIVGMHAKHLVYDKVLEWLTGSSDEKS